MADDLSKGCFSVTLFLHPLAPHCICANKNLFITYTIHTQSGVTRSLVCSQSVPTLPQDCMVQLDTMIIFPKSVFVCDKTLICSTCECDI